MSYVKIELLNSEKYTISNVVLSWQDYLKTSMLCLCAEHGAKFWSTSPKYSTPEEALKHDGNKDARGSFIKQNKEAQR
jgi:hypothetical protein